MFIINIFYQQNLVPGWQFNIIGYTIYNMEITSNGANEMYAH